MCSMPLTHTSQCVSCLTLPQAFCQTDEQHRAIKTVTHGDQITAHIVSVKLDFITGEYGFHAIRPQPLSETSR